ncbi:MAG: gamma-glutamyltransferase family protein [Pseudomonadota bacterium]
MRDLQKPGRSSVLSTNGMCATSHPLASKTAIDVLERGGNAMDAAIAGALLLGFCEPHMTSIGGDCFALFSPAGSDDVLALNGSGRAAAKADAADLRAKGHETVPLYTPDAITIPGAIDAFCHLSDKHGKLGLDAILEPAIHYAEEGVPIAGRVAHDTQSASEKLQGAALTHFSNNGHPLQQGDIFRAPKQAEVLRRIARDGRDAFYQGEVADDILNTLNTMGGVHKADDFAKAVATPTDPISGEYKGLELLEHPPNGQGAAAILMLNMLKHFDIASMDPWGLERAHIEAEACKLAYDTRNRFVGDADHTVRLDHLLSEDTAAKLAALIDPGKSLPTLQPLAEAMHKDTVYITVVDRDRMSVSLIYSLFHGFGSGIASEKFGILLHNRGASFSLEEGHANELKGGKRPMHTIIPGILRQQGRVIMPFGVMGGQYQSHGHARFLSNICDFGLSPQANIDAPRLFVEDGKLQVERGYAPEVHQGLKDLGHDVIIPENPIGGAQAILIHESGVLEGASDPRKDGCALGY